MDDTLNSDRFVNHNCFDTLNGEIGIFAITVAIIFCIRYNSYIHCTNRSVTQPS